MGLEAVWQQFAFAGYQLWVWIEQGIGAHPFLAVGTLVVFVLAWALYKAEVRTK